mmetsp:Transcript_34954/g.71326  ORF Transcript_34954/g.71326 Transcript_34954/m.71326 type:complete len:464 (+) Transcript_34954:106-1497(+)
MLSLARICILLFLQIRLFGSTAEEASSCVGGLPRLAFLIIVHNQDTLDGCIRLVDALYHEDHTFYVHFDTKMDPAAFSYEWRIMSYGRKANMRKLSLHDLKWGSWGMLAPWFSVAQLLTKKETRSWDYFINLSGDSYPVLKPEPLRRRLVENGLHLNYMTCSAGIAGLRPVGWSQFDATWHKRKAFPFPIVDGDERFSHLEAYYGSQWMVVTRSFVTFLLDEMARKDSFTERLAHWFEHGSLEIDTGRRKMRVKPHIPDEIFFPTVLMNSASLNGSSGAPSTVPDYRLPQMRDMWYIRMDEHYPWSNFNQRYDSPADASLRAWGPYYLGSYDLGSIKRSGALFVRKVSGRVDENLMRLLPVENHSAIPDLSWPALLPPLEPRSFDSASARERHPEQDGDESPPAPAPGPSIPGIKVLEKGTAGHVNSQGCVAVAESIHCPPKHNVEPELTQKYDLPIGVGFGG